ncbi:ADP-ribosylglycohydrolase family protein [Streptomyces sp. SID3343]|uniref:ADP-ribosylglycohydrolase family protein n=1 Tax=Streptomyces sp. SID3343 TaxID=2690260 RepID=UPI0013710880|nr:ADP-ribosylglycohydrolase family protein [Streptomyces sp. SID3343]MYW02968.1 ADP-ribosylglycohydrolase family protein [Streptomyces sp. SID3343]
MTVDNAERVRGSMFGLAYGDALGAPTEFLSYAEIVRRHDLPGPLDLVGTPALVTDDTQMALAVAHAVLDARVDGGALRPDTFGRRLVERYLTWWDSPDNTRAPGHTCMSACEELAKGRPWIEATRRGSKGCGANMRVTPLGLLDGIDEATRCGAAQLQSAITHGHPTATAAADLTAAAVHALRGGVAIADLPAYLRDHARAQCEVYRGDWLGDELWRGPFADSPEGFAARGWGECLGVLDRLDQAVAEGDRRSDPCRVTGAGWIAEEALATAVLCVVLYADDPRSALARAAATSGDSDSIAALAGAMLGAVYGMDGWPDEWLERIEYREELDAVSAAFAR